jgi:hypothetical protein
MEDNDTIEVYQEQVKLIILEIIFNEFSFFVGWWFFGVIFSQIILIFICKYQQTTEI